MAGRKNIEKGSALMEIPISRIDAIRLILKTYHQFSSPLFHLYKLSAGNNTPEAARVHDVYKNYLDSIGAVDGEREPGIKIQENLEPELEKADDKELLEILIECKSLAEAYNLSVKDEMPVEIMNENYCKEKNNNPFTIVLTQQSPQEKQNNIFVFTGYGIVTLIGFDDIMLNFGNKPLIKVNVNTTDVKMEMEKYMRSYKGVYGYDKFDRNKYAIFDISSEDINRIIRIGGTIYFSRDAQPCIANPNKYYSKGFYFKPL